MGRRTTPERDMLAIEHEDDMPEMLTPEQIDRIYEITDGLWLHRNAVIVPLYAKPGGLEMIMPDGRVLIRGATGSDFETWFSGLPSRLDEMDMHRARKLR